MPKTKGQSQRSLQCLSEGVGQCTLQTKAWLQPLVSSFPNWLTWYQGDINAVQFNTLQYAKYLTKQIASLSPADPTSKVYPNPVHLFHIAGHHLLQIPILSDFPSFTLAWLLAAFGAVWGTVRNACSTEH